jgi:hypothetical protein
MAAYGDPGYVASPMTVYDGAVRIQGKDGKDLPTWRVAVYQRGQALRHTSVPAPTGSEAVRRARELWPDAKVIGS